MFNRVSLLGQILQEIDEPDEGWDEMPSEAVVIRFTMAVRDTFGPVPLLADPVTEIPCIATGPAADYILVWPTSQRQVIADGHLVVLGGELLVQVDSVAVIDHHGVIPDDTSMPDRIPGPAESWRRQNDAWKEARLNGGGRPTQ